ncbi:MAG: TIR domain-containing protein, partial [Promethearchaeota archaeon]
MSDNEGDSGLENQKYQIFLSYATQDSALFDIPEIAKVLESNPMIKRALYCQRDGGEDWVDYMNNEIPQSDLFILFCSRNANKSDYVPTEWKTAFIQFKSEMWRIITVFFELDYVPPLLQSKNGIKFQPNFHRLNVNNLLDLVKLRLDGVIPRSEHSQIKQEREPIEGANEVQQGDAPQAVKSIFENREERAETPLPMKEQGVISNPLNQAKQYLKQKNFGTFFRRYFVQPRVKRLSEVIGGDGKSQKKTEISGEEFCKEFTLEAEQNSFYILLGDAGTGKTTLLEYFEYYILKELNRIPIRFNFKFFINKTIIARKDGTCFLDSDWLLDTVFGHISSIFPDITRDVFIKGIRDREILLILDGLDEFISRTSTVNIDEWEIILDNLVESMKARVLISTRTTLFSKKKMYKRFENAFELLPWTRTMMEEWLGKNMSRINPGIKDSPEEIFQAIVNITPLSELCTIPFLLNSFSRIYHLIPKRFKDVSRVDIYKILIEDKINQSLKKIPPSKKIDSSVVFKILGKLALEYMTIKLECIDLEDIDFLSTPHLEKNESR